MLERNMERAPVIHIVHSSKSPDGTSSATALCGERVQFGNAISMGWNDGRLCEDCLSQHRQNFKNGVRHGRSVHVWGILA